MAYRDLLPANVLDVQGCLVHHQKQIRRLSLITDGTCLHAGQHLEGLSCFTALTELEWETIQHPSEFSALRGCLQQSSRHLKALSIKFLSAENPPRRCGFADIADLLPSSFRDERTRPDLGGYSLLTSLTLSRVSFPSALLPGVRHSPFRALHTLRDCPNDLRFLQLLARSSRPSPSVTSRLAATISASRGSSSPIVEFLLSFRGLQYLYLKISNFPQFLPSLDDAIHHLQPTYTPWSGLP